MDDLISRQMAIEVVQNRHIMLNKEKVLLINDLEKLPSAQLATDTNVGTKLGTDLAEVGTDCISRQAAIDALDECYCGGEDSCGEPWIYQENAVEAIQMIEPIPPAEPQIIRCNECKWNRSENRKETKQWLPCRALVTPDDFSCIYAER